MKNFTQTLTTVMFLAASATAGPLRKADVAADAKWVLHLDADQLRSTSAGNFVIQEIAEKLLAKPKAIMKQDTGYDLDLSKVRSLTAYGDYHNPVLLLKSDIDVEKVLDGCLARIEKEGKLESPAGGKTVKDGLVTYTLMDRMVVSLRRDKIAIASHSAETNQKADDVLSGKSPNLGSSSAFKEFPEAKKAFFFLGAARGFNPRELGDGHSGDEDQNNPKAKILKMADSGRIILGQECAQLYLNVSLKAKTTAVVTQMQQVIQGMIALASLAQSDNTNIQQLAESAKVTAKDDVVTLSLNFPADQATQMLKSHLSEHLERAEHHHDRESHRAAEARAKEQEK
jgi:hypothetical protein